MRYYRIRTYLQDGTFTACEHLYLAGTSQGAIDRFLRDYPEHRACIVVCEEYDPEQTPHHFNACRECGCVH